jgi:hypothetical protein
LVSDICGAVILSSLVIGVRSDAEGIGLLADEVWHRVLVVLQIRCGVIGGTQAGVIQRGLNKDLLAQIHPNAATKGKLTGSQVFLLTDLLQSVKHTFS